MTDTRQRLLALRVDLLARLAESECIEPAWLNAIAGINAGLAAIDGEAVAAEPATRAVVSDDGQIRLTFYRDDGEAGAVVLTAAGAVHLAGRLLQAASPKLAAQATA